MDRQEPRYRFHGRVQPCTGRQPLAFVPLVGDEDGTAVLRVYDPIDSWGGDWGISAKEFAAALDELPEGTERIRLHLNSPGGEVFEGLAILAQLRRHRATVTTVVDGLAASIASVIALAGDELVMSANAELMIHDAWGICMGNAADMRSLAQTLDHLSDNVASVYAGKAGGTTADWRGLMLAETWFGAEEAVAAGLADRIEGSPEAEAAVAAGFDLSGFKYAGRAAAPAPATPPEGPAGRSRASMDRRHRMNTRKAYAAS